MNIEKLQKSCEAAAVARVHTIYALWEEYPECISAGCPEIDTTDCYDQLEGFDESDEEDLVIAWADKHFPQIFENTWEDMEQNEYCGWTPPKDFYRLVNAGVL